MIFVRQTTSTHHRLGGRTARVAELGKKVQTFSIEDIQNPDTDWDHLPKELQKDGTLRPVWYRPWAEYHHDCKILARKLQDFADQESMKWWGMLIIPRGGLIGGGIVARELNIRNVQTLPMSLYDDTKQSGQLARNLMPLNPRFADMMRERGRGLLLFDDLIDTMTTNLAIRQQLGSLTDNTHFAAVYAKAGSEARVDTYVTRVPSREIWVRHPWDIDYGHSTPISGPDGN